MTVQHLKVSSARIFIMKSKRYDLVAIADARFSKFYCRLLVLNGGFPLADDEQLEDFLYNDVSTIEFAVTKSLKNLLWKTTEQDF